jgi:hypothetical protein
MHSCAQPNLRWTSVWINDLYVPPAQRCRNGVRLKAPEDESLSIGQNKPNSWASQETSSNALRAFNVRPIAPHENASH